NFRFSPRITNLGEVARFRRTRGQAQKYPSRLLRNSVFSDRRYTQFSTQSVRTFLSRTSVRICYTDFSSMVSRTVNRLRPHDDWRHDIIDCSLHRASTNTADVVDLGNRPCGDLPVYRGFYGTPVHRAALYYVQTSGKRGNQRPD